MSELNAYKDIADSKKRGQDAYVRRVRSNSGKPCSASGSKHEGMAKGPLRPAGAVFKS